ncbi:hypothetical protein V6N12_042214 [Hibiscus sabdariffa]|uniref:Uncharacterized protein n=1 Tax=Hibiscus sabdariffa TaxID=183260 RepID=A0ABR2EE41_9ROSI
MYQEEEEEEDWSHFLNGDAAQCSPFSTNGNDDAPAAFHPGQQFWTVMYCLDKILIFLNQFPGFGSEADVLPYSAQFNRARTSGLARNHSVGPKTSDPGKRTFQ